MFPDLRREVLLRRQTFRQVQSLPVQCARLGAVLRVLNEDERKVIETLVAGGGTMLQKDIRWKPGLSRVKTHRILSRLAKRGIVSAEKYYSTDNITLADWLTKKSVRA